MRSAAIRDVNFNLGEDDDGGDGGGGREGGEGESGGGRRELHTSNGRALAAIHDLDHISSPRENSSTDYY